MVVTSELEKLGFHDITVNLGEAEIREEISAETAGQSAYSP